MVSPSVKVLSVVLTISLIASCFLSCYTFAYADDLTDGGDRNVSAEEQEEIVGESSGVELSAGVGKSNSYGVDGGAAGEGYGPDVGAAEETREDSSSDNEGLIASFSSVSRASVAGTIAASWGAMSDACNRAWSYMKGYWEWWFGSSWKTVVTEKEQAAALPDFMVVDLLRQQWGYNFGTGNTIVYASNSPAGWLNYLYEGSWYTGSLAGSSSSGTYRPTQLLAYIYSNTYNFSTRMNELLTAFKNAWGYGYGGTAVITKNSPAAWLQYIYQASSYTGSLAGSDGSGTYTLGQLLAWSYSNIYHSAQRLASIASSSDLISTRLVYSGSLAGSDTSGAYTVAQLLSWIYSNVYHSAQRLASIVSSSDLIASRLVYSGSLAGSETSGTYTVAQLLSWLYSNSFNSGNRISLIVSILESISDLLSSFDFSDKSLVDLSETNKLLGRLTGDVASIRDKLVLEDTLSDLLDLLVGDMQVPQTQAAISRIQDVMATRFPFCIPSVVNVVLFGSLLADPAPPVWTFDVGGSPLVVDFADYGAFAEVSSWTVRLLFTAALLLNTRRFVYGVGGGD